jgi:hypothetical protein
MNTTFSKFKIVAELPGLRLASVTETRSPPVSEDPNAPRGPSAERVIRVAQADGPPGLWFYSDTGEWLPPEESKRLNNLRWADALERVAKNGG